MKPWAFLTLLNCCSFMVLASSLSFKYCHEAQLIRMAQARNGRPLMPTCGQVFARPRHRCQAACCGGLALPDDLRHCNGLVNNGFRSLGDAAVRNVGSSNARGFWWIYPWRPQP